MFVINQVSVEAGVFSFNASVSAIKVDDSYMFYVKWIYSSISDLYQIEGCIGDFYSESMEEAIEVYEEEVAIAKAHKEKALAITTRFLNTCYQLNGVRELNFLYIQSGIEEVECKSTEDGSQLMTVYRFNEYKIIEYVEENHLAIVIFYKGQVISQREFSILEEEVLSVEEVLYQTLFEGEIEVDAILWHLRGDTDGDLE